MSRKTTTMRFVLLTSLALQSTLAMAESNVPKAPAQKSGAEVSFDKLKTLAGPWAGQVTTFPPEPDLEGKVAQFSLRVTSRGNAFVHELWVPGEPDHPVTMFYLDADRLTLTHYCDAGNRPRMAAKASADGKTLEFDLLDVSGGNHYGHMHHALFTFIDANHHTEDWTYMGPDDQPVRAHFDLQRTTAGTATSDN